MASTVLDQKYYTREEAAELLKLSVRTLDRLRYAGKIHATYLSPHKIRFTEEDLRAYLSGEQRAS